MISGRVFGIANSIIHQITMSYINVLEINLSKKTFKYLSIIQIMFDENGIRFKVRSKNEIDHGKIILSIRSYTNQ